MPDFGRRRDFASSRAIQSDVRARSVSGQHLLPEDLLFEWDAETGKIFAQGTTNEILHSGDFPSDTVWTTITSLLNGWTGTIKYTLWVGWVMISLTADGSAKSSNVAFQVGPNYQPSESLWGSVSNGSFVLNTNGDLELTAMGNVEGFIVYPVL